MKKILTKVNFNDHRGVIVDLLQKEKINAVTFLTINKNKVRGNHYHKKTYQWNYIISGQMVLVSRINKKIKSKVLKKGDLYLTEPYEHHALIGKTKCEVLVFTKGPRGGKEYETDTFRLKDDLSRLI
jgi:mannose-6-phosphate isomerase-like protein (cupin superfamily)